MVISVLDYKNVMQYVDVIEHQYPTRFRDIRLLKEKLLSSKKVQPQEVPPDIVTMNSVVVLRRSDSEITFSMRLVYPEYDNLREHCISVLSALGVAIFLQRTGDEVCYCTWKKENRIRIMDIIFQPEANGNFYRK
jgi:regulator of nucleoside diphosphate kinase